MKLDSLRIRRSLLAIAGLMVLTAPAARAADNFILCGASPGGLWTLLGTGLDAVVKVGDSASSVTYQTSSGGFANLVQIQQGKCDLAIVHVGEAVIGMKGQAPFKAPVTGFKAVAVLYDWAPMQWIASKEWADKNGITSIADIAAKKPKLNLVTNRQGILPAILAKRSLELAGINYADIEKWGGSVQFQGSKTASDLVKDGKADMWVNAMFIGTGGIREIADAHATTLLSVPDTITKEMTKEFGSVPWTVKGGAYPWLAKDVVTFGARAALIVGDKMPAAKIEQLTAAMIKHFDKIRAVHKAMAPFDGKLMASLKDIPYHPAAIAAYKKAGLQ